MKLGELLGREFTCACGQIHRIPTKEILMGKGVVKRLPLLMEKYVRERNVLLLSDERTYAVCGKEAEGILLRDRFRVKTLIFKGEKVIADEETATRAKVRAGEKADIILACGSGTINDLGKYASTEVGIPYISLATAPSMNGYTSSIVALKIKGVKRTLPAVPPVAVVADLNVLSYAPAEMLAAGVGDLISRPVSNLDWKISNLLKDEYYCPFPIEIMEEVERRFLKELEGLPRRDSASIRALTEGLMYSGISLTIAGSSAPGSGGEHLISHLLDMRAQVMHREPSLHGAQVGIGTLFTSALYQEISHWQEDDLRNETLSWGEEERRIRGFFQSLGEEVWKEFQAKYGGSQERERIIRRIRENWLRITETIRKFLRPPQETKYILQKGGAPTTPEELGVSHADFKEIVLHAREIRSRYTVLDLAFDAGILPDRTNEIMEMAFQI